MLIGISLVMMPTQTHALNQLPKYLYLDGTAVFSTVQQVSGAISGDSAGGNLATVCALMDRDLGTGMIQMKRLFIRLLI